MGEIVNPYIAGAPVTEQRMFFGRDDIFQWIENSIAGQFADHILVIHGQRRVGKTSVLKQLGNRLPKRFIPVFFDLQGRTHTTLDHFLWWLARETVRVLKQDRDIEVLPPPKEAFASDPEFFENQFLTSLRAQLGKDTLLLTFDEFDNLEESEVKEELARPLIDHLRRLMGQPNLNFIFSIGSSGRKLENMQAAYTEFFKAALYKKISFLNEEQTHNLVTRPVAGIIEYERAAVDRIYGITSGHPYFTQLTCHELFARCQRTEQRRIAKPDVEAVLDDVVERGTVNLKFIWDEASDIEKWTLAALAEMDKADNRAVAETLRKNRVRFSESDLTSGLLHLREKDVLTPQNRFVIHLMRLWLQKNRPIEQVREELTEANPIANRFIEIGLEFRDGGQHEKAIEYFRQALSVSPENLQAQVNIALTYAAQGLLEQAVTEFEKALTIDDEDVVSRAGLCDAHLALGDAAMKRGSAKDAVLSYQRVLEINAEHTEARGRMAEIARQRAEKALTEGRDEEALSAFAEALKYTPEDETLSARVDAVRAAKKAKLIASLVARSEKEARELNWEAAIRTLEEASALSPEDSDIQKRLSNAREKFHEKKLADLKARAQGLATAEKFDEALKAWREYLSLAPSDSEQIEEELVRIRSQQELFELYTNANQAIASRDFDKAIKLLKEVIYRDENYKDASRLLTKAIDLRRAPPRLEQVKPRTEPVQTQPTRVKTAPKMSRKQIGVVGGVAAVLALVAAGIFFGQKVWKNIAIATQQAAGVTPTSQIAIATPTLSAEFATIEPVLAYIAEAQPDFEEDFSTSQPYWYGTQIGNDTLASRVKDGALPFSYKNGGEGFEIADLGRDFVLEFDYKLKSEDENSHIIIKYRVEGNGSEVIKFNPYGFGLLGRSGNYPVKVASDQVYHFRLLVLEDQIAVFINNKLIEYSDGPSQAGGTGIGFVTYAETGFDASLDNIKFWNLQTFKSSLPAATDTASPATETQISPKDGMVMVYVPAGGFSMGSDSGSSNEKPVHTVYLDSFWIDQTEVTNKMYSLCVSAGICQPPKSANSYSRISYYENSDFENYPVIYVDWDMANTYCTWAGRRLPTEAEWEKAARGTTKSTYPWGDEADGEKANYMGIKGDTTPVGVFDLGKSPYGVFDLAGNVMEWVADWYSSNYYANSPRENPLGPSSGTAHVLRGGSWKSNLNSIRSSYRFGLNPDMTNFYLIGFRCALDASQ
jgi:formylglycine-generating enzyme required for sulfatase activity/tetratricopeptide (TPR) repeat protein